MGNKSSEEHKDELMVGKEEGKKWLNFYHGRKLSLSWQHEMF